MSSSAFQHDTHPRASRRATSSGPSRDEASRPRMLSCLMTYVSVACLSVMGLQVLGDVWAWSAPVQLWTSAVLGGVLVPSGTVALVRSRWRVCGPEVAIIALTLAGLAVGVRLAALLPR